MQCYEQAAKLWFVKMKILIHILLAICLILNCIFISILLWLKTKAVSHTFCLAFSAFSVI